MRRTTLAVVLVLLVSAIPAQAQSWAPKAGLIAGANLTDLQIRNSSTGAPDSIYSGLHGQVVPGVGASLTSRIFDRLSARMEFMWLEKGQTIGGDFFGLPASMDISYFEIPLFAVFDLKGGSVRPYVLGGPSLGLLLGAYVNIHGENADEQFSQDIKASFNAVDVGLVGGVGVAWLTPRARVFIESRYMTGLTNIEINPARTIKTRGLQFMIGVSAR